MGTDMKKRKRQQQSTNTAQTAPTTKTSLTVDKALDLPTVVSLVESSVEKREVGRGEGYLMSAPREAAFSAVVEPAGSCRLGHQRYP